MTVGPPSFESAHPVVHRRQSVRALSPRHSFSWRPIACETTKGKLAAVEATQSTATHFRHAR